MTYSDVIYRRYLAGSIDPEDQSDCQALGEEDAAAADRGRSAEPLIPPGHTIFMSAECLAACETRRQEWLAEHPPAAAAEPAPASAAVQRRLF